MYVEIEGKQVFLIDPRHYEYASGRGKFLGYRDEFSIASRQSIYRVILIFVAGILFLNHLRTASETSINELFLLIFFLVVVSISGLVLLRYLFEYLLVTGGHILFGTILEATGRQETSEWFDLTVKYEFNSSTGKQICKTVSVNNQYMKNAELPEAGTTVAILYLSDRLFRAI